MPRATVGIPAAFGVYVVSARGQPAGTGEFVSSDAAPDSGNYSGRGPARFIDPAGDHHSAPDIAGIRVTDSGDGWVNFAISMPNSAVLPRAPVVGLSIDVDDDLATGDSGADLGDHGAGHGRRGRHVERAILGPGFRMSTTRRSGPTSPVPRSRSVCTGSQLGAGSRLGFAALAAGLASSEGFTGVDVTPDGARFFRYVLQNTAEVKLVVGNVRTAPARPIRGARLTVSTTVSRSDGASTRSVVRCLAKADGKRVVTTSRYVGERASCTFAVPKKAKRVSGSMTIRADGISSTVPFSFRVR